MGLFRVRTSDESSRVLKLAKGAGAKALRKAAWRTRSEMRKSIRRSDLPSAPGTAPHTRRGALPNAILYDVDAKKGVALVGPAAHLFSDVGFYHEFGGVQAKRGKRKTYGVGMSGPVALGRSGGAATKNGVTWGRLKTPAQAARATELDRAAFPDATTTRRRKYPERPFALPALARISPKLPELWRGAFR